MPSSSTGPTRKRLFFRAMRLTTSRFAPQELGRDILSAKERSYRFYVLLRNERDLPRPISMRSIVVARNTLFGDQRRRFYFIQRLLSART